MTNSELDLQKETLNPNNELSSLETLDDGAYLFISFDLENSTKFKTELGRGEDWAVAITRFYEVTEAEVKKKFPTTRMWKCLGDEILFYIKVSSAKDIYDSPKIVYDIQAKVQSFIDDLLKERGHLAIKATMWIGGARRIGAMSDGVLRNVLFSQNANRADILDFLGEDVDIGFRIAKHAFKKKSNVECRVLLLTSPDVETARG